MGFWDDVVKHFTLRNIVENSKDSSGRPDPLKAAGIAYSLGYDKSEDLLHLGAIMNTQDDFDDSSSQSDSHPFSSFSDDLPGSDVLSWRDYCEDGSDYDLDPEDYATEEEYEEFCSWDIAFVSSSGQILPDEPDDDDPRRYTTTQYTVDLEPSDDDWDDDEDFEEED